MYSKVTYLLIFFWLILFVSGCTKTTQKQRVLHIYTWANYTSPALIKTFEEKTGAKIDLNYFSSNEELMAKLQAGVSGYDLIFPTGYLLNSLKALKLIQPLGKIDWPELEKLIPKIRTAAYDPQREYAIPYGWGTAGLGINRKKLKEKVDSWSWVFDHPELKGQISMMDDAPSVVGVALKYLGYSYNETSSEALNQVKQLLIKQKKLLKAYTPESLPVLENGEITIAHSYSCVTLQAQRKNPAIEYVLPKEGGEIYLDYMAIPVGAASTDLAKEFMRMSLDQKMVLALVEHMFASPVISLQNLRISTVENMLSKHGVLPTNEELNKYEMMMDNPSRQETIQRLWIELKSI